MSNLNAGPADRVPADRVPAGPGAGGTGRGFASDTSLEYNKYRWKKTLAWNKRPAFTPRESQFPMTTTVWRETTKEPRWYFAIQN